MQPTWKPISDVDFCDLLAMQSAALSPESEQRFAQTAVTPFQAIVRRSEQYGDERVWVVAKADDRIVFFDDVEDEFAIGRIDADGRVYDYWFSGDLTDAMFGFPGRLDRPSVA